MPSVAEAPALPIAVSTPEPAVAKVGARSEGRIKSALKERVQAGSANFEFAALLDGVSTLDAIPSRVNVKDGAELIWMPAGEFLMGSDSGERRELPVHPVSVDGFWIYKTPVTVAQYRMFYNDIGRSLRTAPVWGWRDDDPIVNVSWEYACAYAQWAGAELPTEAEWEYAARGTESRRYPWGDSWSPEKCINSVTVRRYGVAPVGRIQQGATPNGIADLAGNVWEWTADWYDETYYALSPERNPQGPAFGTHRVLRGGSWGNELSHDFRCSTRAACEPSVRGSSIGFRCIVRSGRTLAP